MACHGNHSGIVGSECALGDKRLDAPTVAILLHGGSHTAVGTNTATYCHSFNACVLNGFAKFVHQYVDDSLLQRCGKVGLVLLNEVGIKLYLITQGV